jgi:hypothetical protein
VTADLRFHRYFLDVVRQTRPDPAANPPVPVAAAPCQ